MYDSVPFLVRFPRNGECSACGLLHPSTVCGVSVEKIADAAGRTLHFLVARTGVLGLHSPIESKRKYAIYTYDLI